MLENFDERIVCAQKAAMKQDWESFKKIFQEQEDKEKLLYPFDLNGNTAIHAVTRSGNVELLKELLAMLSTTKRKDALRKPNVEGNTLLHEAIFAENFTIVDFIIDCHREDQNDEPLLELKNKKGETPLFRAARFGKLRMLQYIHAKYPLQHKHFPPAKDRGSDVDDDGDSDGDSDSDGNRDKMLCPILHICVLGLHFDVAIWLVKMDESLMQEKYKNVDENENESLPKEEYGKTSTCFQLLSRMPMAFRSKGTLELGITEEIIYNLLPEMDVDGKNLLLKSTTDIESGQSDHEAENTSKSKIAVFSSINYAVWKLLAKGFNSIEKIWNQKKRHVFAQRLAKLLVNSDDSWLDSYNGDDQPLVVLPDVPFNVTKKIKEIELKENERIKKQKKNKKLWQTPLFLAAALGIMEVVKIIVHENPEAIAHVNNDGLNILHIAVHHRQLEIYEYIGESAAFDSLLARITKKDHYTILHQAASMKYYRETILPGVAYQLQDELEWYHVAVIVPPSASFLISGPPMLPSSCVCLLVLTALSLTQI